MDHKLCEVPIELLAYFVPGWLIKPALKGGFSEEQLCEDPMRQKIELCLLFEQTILTMVRRGQKMEASDVALSC